MGGGSLRISLTLQKRNSKPKLEEIEGYGRNLGAQSVCRHQGRRRISLERFIYALGMRHVGETTALALRGAMAPGRRFMTRPSRSPKATRRPSPRWMRSIRSATPDQERRAYIRRSHNRGIVERLGRSSMESLMPKTKE